MTLSALPEPGGSDARLPRVPNGIGATGKRLWRAVVAEYELDPQGLALLEQACRTVDTIANLEAVSAAEGVMSESSQGARVHPAIVEARQQRAILARLVAALGLDVDEQPEAEAVRLSRSAAARKAARTRWSAPSSPGGVA